MKYKITQFNEQTGSVVVEFSTEYPPLFVDIPLDEAGLFITGEVLDNYIQGFIPTWHMKRLETLKQGIPNASEILALVQPSDIIPTTASNSEEVAALAAETQAWEEQQFEEKVLSILNKRQATLV